MTTYNGKCHCGEVEWTVKLDKPETVLCHCNTCKTLSGGAFSLNALVPKDDLKITKGSLKTYTYKGDSGNPVHCYYCPTCTAHAYHHQTVAGDVLVARTILLDGGAEFKPVAELWGKAKIAWIPEMATTFDTVPPS